MALYIQRAFNVSKITVNFGVRQNDRFMLAGSDGSFSNPFIGGRDFFMSIGWKRRYRVYDSSAPFFATWFFKWTFASAAATISSGAMAERTKVLGYLINTIVTTAFIYPVVVHWVWSSEGFLSPSRGYGL